MTSEWCDGCCRVEGTGTGGGRPGHPWDWPSRRYDKPVVGCAATSFLSCPIPLSECPTLPPAPPSLSQTSVALVLLRHSLHSQRRHQKNLSFTSPVTMTKSLLRPPLLVASPHLFPLNTRPPLLYLSLPHHPLPQLPLPLTPQNLLVRPFSVPHRPAA